MRSWPLALSVIVLALSSATQAQVHRLHLEGIDSVSVFVEGFDEHAIDAGLSALTLATAVELR